MNDQILVSIAVLTFNHESFIHDALKGVLMQKVNFKYEIVIADDCSSDRTPDILIQYKLNFPDIIKVIRTDSNVGPLKNGTNLLETCMGRYLAICEGDDFWNDPFKLQKQVDFLESNPDYGLIHSDANHYYEIRGHLLTNYNKVNGIHFPSGDIFNEYLKGDLFIHTATVMTRRYLFLKAADYDLFQRKGWLLQDLPTWLQIAYMSKIKYMPETTATYRLNQESASKTNDPRKLSRFHQSVYDIRYYFWNKYSQDVIIKRILDEKYTAMLMGDAYKCRDISLARKAILQYHELNLAVQWKDRMKYFVIFIINSLRKVNWRIS